MVTRKRYIRAVALCLVIGVVLLAVFAFGKVKTGGYAAVTATVVDTYTKAAHSRYFGTAYYRLYEFSYGGETYRAEQRVFAIGGKRSGDKAELRINPVKPAEVEDTYGSVVCSAGGGFMLTLAVVLIACRKRVRYASYEPQRNKKQ